MEEDILIDWQYMDVCNIDLELGTVIAYINIHTCTCIYMHIL